MKRGTNGLNDNKYRFLNGMMSGVQQFVQKSKMTSIGIVTSLSLLFGCAEKNKEGTIPFFPESVKIEDIDAERNVSSNIDANSQKKDTNPYILQSEYTSYESFEDIVADSGNMVALHTHKKIFLDKNEAGESEKHASGEKYKNLSQQEFVYLQKDALRKFLYIQDQVNLLLRQKGYQQGQVYFIVTSTSRSQDAQDYLKGKNNNATKSLSAHSIGFALDLIDGEYMYDDLVSKQKLPLKDKDTRKIINALVVQVLEKEQEKGTIYITPESSGIVHIVFKVLPKKITQNNSEAPKAEGKKGEPKSPVATPELRSDMQKKSGLEFVRDNGQYLIYSYTLQNPQGGNVGGVIKNVKKNGGKKFAGKSVIVCNEHGKPYSANTRFTKGTKVYIKIKK